MVPSTSAEQILKNFLFQNKELEKLQAISNEFNIFRALGLKHQEIRHSNFLAWLLDPRETHGFGDEFLQLFLKHLTFHNQTGALNFFEIDRADLKGTEVMREWHNIDLFIRNDDLKLAVVIENKIGSGEHSDQLSRYYAIVEREYPDYRLLCVYLTVDGEIPSDEHFLSISYTDIAELVEVLIQSQRHKATPAITLTIEHYLQLLRRYIMQDSEVQSLCRKIDSLRSK